MKIYILQAIFILFLMLFNSCNQGQKLFEENSEDWDSFGEASWTFSGDELAGTVSDDKTGFIMTRDTFSNFILELEFRPDTVINSGVFVRCSKKEINTTDCYELNIWDRNPNQDYRTGAMVMKTRVLARVETIDRWNTYKIVAEGKRIRAWVNDTLTTDITDDSLSEGHIGLQALGNGTIKFRNIRIITL